MATMQALISSEDHSAKVQSVPIPKANEGEILVKVHAVSLNPTDWKHTYLLIGPGKAIGCDFSGIVEDPKSSKWKKGDRVAGWVHGASADPPRGSFAEYAITDQDMVYRIPDNISFEDAAVVPLAFSTAVQAMYQRLGLPEPSKPSQASMPFLVYGGTTSVGKYAIQLAKKSGLFVIATGSKKNHELLKSLGADVTVDYKSSNWVDEVKKVCHDNLRHALDSIAENGTTRLVGQCMSSKGGKIITLLPPKDEVPKNVETSMTLAYTVFGRELHYGAWGDYRASPEDHAVWVKYLSLLPGMLEKGTIKPSRVKLMDGGLGGIVAGFDLMKDNKVSAEKLVYKIA